MKLFVLFLMFKFMTVAYAKSVWPPKVDKEFPELRLYNDSGIKVNIDQFKGKVVLIEIASMSCPACHALAGGNQLKKKFRETTPQEKLPSIKKIFNKYSKVSSEDDRVVFVQIFAYKTTEIAPEKNDLIEWQNHFKNKHFKNHHLFYEKEILRMQSRAQTPAFYLLDKNLVVRSVAAGSKQSLLYSELLPMIKELL